MKHVLIIMGSVRNVRICPEIANWLISQISSEVTFKSELIDLAEWHLPMDDESEIPAYGSYRQEHTKKWSEKVNSADGFIFLTPQYNHGYPAPLKNALDHLFKEWSGKPAAVVTYGSHGGSSCSTQLQHVLKMMKMQVVGTAPQLNISREVIKAGVLKDPSGDLAPYSDTVKSMAKDLESLLAS